MKRRSSRTLDRIARSHSGLFSSRYDHSPGCCCGFLHLDTADPDGERYLRCISCARAFGVRARSRRRASANVYRRGRRRLVCQEAVGLRSQKVQAGIWALWRWDSLAVPAASEIHCTAGSVPGVRDTSYHYESPTHSKTPRRRVQLPRIDPWFLVDRGRPGIGGRGIAGHRVRLARGRA